MTDANHADPAGENGIESGRGPVIAAVRSDQRSRSSTRTRIQQVAVELFTEHGYDGTSLREIAERLDVTKAALYYHFKSKEDIVASLIEDYVGQLDALVTWGAQQPRTPAFQRELLDRYARIVEDRDKVFRMLHQNQAAVHTMAEARRRGTLFKERMFTLVDLMTGPDASLTQRVRAAMALGSISIGWMSFADQVDDRHALAEVVRAVAHDFLDPKSGQD